MMTRGRTHGSRRRTTAWCLVTSFVSWLVILLVVAVLAAAVLVPRLGGATPYSILTGSMRPTMPSGTLVVVKPVHAADLRAGDVITYQLRSGAPEVVTHRIVSIGSTLAGERVFRTQGDANDAVDPKSVEEVQVKGRVWYSMPALGRVNTWLSSTERGTLTAGVGGALVLYAAWMFTGAIRDPRRERQDARKESTT